MRQSFKLVPVAAVLAALLAASGCGWFGSDSGQPVEAFDTPAQVLATQAEQDYRDGNYDDAADTFQQLKDRYPYSRYALLADLRVGDAYYKAERYDEAVLAYEDFIRLHPTNEAVPYALHQMGMVYYDQMLTVDRDPTMAKKAADTFQRLLENYPDNEWAIKARPRFQEAVARQAGHDMVVGRFYFNTERYRAASSRFKKVLTNYPDVGLYKEAMEYLAQAQAELAKKPAGEREGEEIQRPVIEAPVPGGDTSPVGTGGLLGSGI